MSRIKLLIIPFQQRIAFERTSTTTVDFSGQNSRLLMLDEMGNGIKTAATNGTGV
jgi:hypothetical protein